MDQAGGAPSPAAVAAPEGFAVSIEHVPDPRGAFYLATIRCENEGPVHLWGVVALSEPELLTATARRLGELIALRSPAMPTVVPGEAEAERPEVA